MKLAEKELAGIHKDWMDELEELRKPETVYLRDVEEKEEILALVKKYRTNNGKGVVSFINLSKIIEKRYGYKFSKTTIGDWMK